MLDDIERAGVKPGARRAFVRDLLGEPDGTDAIRDHYELGYQTFAPETAYIDIIYNSDGVVTEVMYVSR